VAYLAGRPDQVPRRSEAGPFDRPLIREQSLHHLPVGRFAASPECRGRPLSANASRSRNSKPPSGFPEEPKAAQPIHRVGRPCEGPVDDTIHRHIVEAAAENRAS